MVARSAGSFLGGIFNNPGALIGLIALGGLFIFRDKISDFFQKGFDNFGKVDVTLPTINLPAFPEFPAFPDFSNIFQGFQDQLSSLAGQTVDGVTIPGDNIVNPDGTVSGSPPTFRLDDLERENALRELEINRLRSMLENRLDAIPPEEDLSGAEFNKARIELENRDRQGEQQIQAIINQNVQTGIPGQTFQGGGPSFQGGSVSEIPISRLSLGQIIDRFNVTASQASDIRARALDDFGGFDFGTNTGSGIGNIPVIPNIGQTSGGFEGLTPQEIALRLTGGNISNF